MRSWYTTALLIAATGNTLVKQYLKLLRRVLVKGNRRNDRTGTGIRSLFAQQISCELTHRFPLLTTKKVHFTSVLHELLWFIRGDTNVDYLNRHGVAIWNKWADTNGELGPIYGQQWRSWRTADGRTVDQLHNVITQIRQNPYSRRLIVCAWNVGELEQMRLPPCHVLFQFYVQDGHLSCQLYQRSADIFIGVPFNIASYALLTMMIAQVCQLQPGRLIHTFGDIHLYENHVEQAKDQLSRTVRPLPRIEINRRVQDLFAFRYADFELQDYTPHPAIAAPVAV